MFGLHIYMYFTFHLHETAVLVKPSISSKLLLKEVLIYLQNRTKIK